MQRCHILALPPELRNKIYAHILVHDSPIQISEPPCPPNATAVLHFDRIQEPAFLLTNRQIRHEALPIFYGDNVFFTAVKDAVPPFLRAIGPEKTKLIRHVRGFRPSRYFKYEWARNLVGAVGREWVKAGLCLGKGVFRMPFGVEGVEGKVFWVGSEDGLVLETTEGCVEFARDAFEVVRDVEVEGGVRLVGARLVGG